MARIMRYKRLDEVIADILTHNGAILARSEDGSLEVLAPPHVSKALKVPEYTRLRFSYAEISDGTTYASYDSEFFTSLGNLFAGRGRFSIASCESYTPNIEKLSRLISEKIAFSNATFRLGKSEVKNISYLLFYFKYVALSDEKREGILSLLINEANLSTLPFEHDATELKEIEDKPQDTVKHRKAVPFARQHSKTFHRQNWPKAGIERHEIKKVFQSACSVSTRLVEERMADFIKSLERRLNRDIRRVYEYYDTLKKETKKVLKKKALAKAMSELNLLQKMEEHASRHDMQAIERLQQDIDSRIEKQIEDRTIKGDGIDKLFNKLDVIEAERKWKIQDLVAKYALNIKIEPVSTIRINTQSTVFWINIKRRLSSRQFPITFNPMTRQIDALPCESCFNPQKPYYICDDELHIICARCFKTCPDCGKKYCIACYNICPKCRKMASLCGFCPPTGHR